MSSLSANAWTGAAAAAGDLAETAIQWAMQPSAGAARFLYATTTDPRNWRDPTVGWGLIAAENDVASIKDRAVGADLPESIRDLLAARPQSPVFRYRADLGIAYLRRYYADGLAQDTATSGGERGTARGRLPQYLLIYGSPSQVPWSLQFYLNVAGFVGRLDLDEAALRNYVRALISDWAGNTADVNRPVAWSVDHGGGDITTLMRKTIAEPIHAAWVADQDIGKKAIGLFGATAKAAALKAALKAAKPSLIVTTSHGMTGPLDNPAVMKKQLGFLVDQDYALVSDTDLLAEWQPNGAIWYAHACCSAGSDVITRFDGLVSAGSSVDQILKGIAALGAMVGPLPKGLLGAAKPLRAFVGHVEPTFDWTIKAATGQPLTASIKRAFYTGMYRKQPETIGLAMDPTYRLAGELFAQVEQAKRDMNSADPATRASAKDNAIRARLSALDRQSMVILGDPTALLPPLKPS